uniref:VPS37 C-terminal domain-containing protein n=1 Tax=Norrisiella sphaerica TaxID=552664 RepID=A0A7S2VV24_9EUKA|mmetsp:Transcript_1860/g.2642  ORF Transcript_1860/g.2642 Transcript_1860/m.2642 type:complete len:114 (+) Transcript_1860:819-1160(+)|eukprot:CAMPEP_0184483536 /NCGR_PEP_ID=MMETSP0113_2-20130426/5198_1 /TAXON_ID=91329 /ORGANISM="Norrisiella sphaerica, Strain BC52" /LENGTH=113 /DNA_ID=CAMNT_0026864011 /DNA_START=799 /DNA_END=1140 /DNA_ORIENTATION=+
MEELAAQNIKTKPNLEAAMRQLEKLRSVEREKRIRVTKLIEEQQRILMKFSPEMLRAGLSKAMNKADEASEEVMESFNNNQLEDVGDFLQKYINERTLFHIRMAKEERLRQLR